ncbi:aspartate aminotransferase family protein [soil metagenome]
MTEINPADGVKALELDRAHVFHSWSAQAALKPFAIAKAQGSTVWDYDGAEYLDFSSQLINMNIGHQHPAVVAAIKAQADELTMIAPAHASLPRGEAAQRILEKAGAPFSKVFFTNGGADANENAMRLARLVTGRDTILSHYRSYHGNTGAAVVATGDWRRVPNQFARGHIHFFGPYAYRSEFWADSAEQESERALHHLERVIESEGPASIAAILLEGVPGTAGILVPPPGYLAGVRALADKHGILLIMDEVMSGFGRTGEWFAWQGFSRQEGGWVPDLITFAKGVNSGYVPAGGVIIPEAIAAHFDDVVFPGGLTYSGHPLAMAAIIGSIDAMVEERIVENAAAIGREHIGPGLSALAQKHDVIGEVRGRGVFWAIELVSDPVSREPVPAAEMAKVKAELMARGLLPITQDNRIHVVPPCVVTPEEVARAMVIYDQAISAVWG